MKKNTFFFSCCLVVLFFLFAVTEKVGGQSLNGQTLANTQIPIPTAIPTATPIAVSPSAIPTDQVIDLYKQALEVSQNTVDNVHTTTNIVLAVVGFVFTAISLAIAGGTWLIGNTINKSAEQLEKAREQIIKKQEEFDQRAKELTATQEKMLEQVKSALIEVAQFRTELSQEKSSREKDRALLKRPLTLVQIDEYGLQLASGNEEERIGSISALVEMSTRLDAIVRLRSVKTLGRLEIYDESAAKRLKEIAETDVVKIIRTEAERSLKLIKERKNITAKA